MVSKKVSMTVPLKWHNKALLLAEEKNTTAAVIWREAALRGLQAHDREVLRDSALVETLCIMRALLAKKDDVTLDLVQEETSALLGQLYENDNDED